jgi:hypothetical protein
MASFGENIGTSLIPYAKTCQQGYRPEYRGKDLVCVPASQPQPVSTPFGNIDPRWLLVGGAVVLLLVVMGSRR